MAGMEGRNFSSYLLVRHCSTREHLRSEVSAGPRKREHQDLDASAGEPKRLSITSLPTGGTLGEEAGHGAVFCYWAVVLTE